MLKFTRRLEDREESAQAFESLWLWRNWLGIVKIPGKIGENRRTESVSLPMMRLSVARLDPNSSTIRTILGICILERC
jgi:hypothetical protein